MRGAGAQRPRQYPRRPRGVALGQRLTVAAVPGGSAERRRGAVLALGFRALCEGALPARLRERCRLSTPTVAVIPSTWKTEVLK